MKQTEPFPGWQLRLIWATLLRPWMWPVTLQQMLRLVPRLIGRSKRKDAGVKAEGSFNAYLRMRTEISHGDADFPTRSVDILEWLNWCREYSHIR